MSLVASGPFTIDLMEIAASDLARILDLYTSGLYVQAYRLGASVAPLKDWEGTAARLLAGRLARQIGSPRLSRWHMIRAYRGQPTHPEAIYYHARYYLERHNLLKSWRFLREREDAARDAAPELRADLYSLHAFIAARLRDFEQSERWIDRALELAPDRPWIYVERSACLEFAERFDHALAAANRALELRPFFRPAVQAAAQLLLTMDRDAEALELLTQAVKRIECAAVVSQLAALQDELGRHEEARCSYDRFAELSPLMEEEVAQWLAARRSDVLYDLGDLEGSRQQALQAGEGFHKTVAERLAHIAPGAKRAVLEKVDRLPRPLPATVPAALMIIRRYWRPDEPAPGDDPFRLDAPLEYQERRWAEQNGWAAREFTATAESLHALIDAGVPVALGVVEATFAQLQAIAGYDQRKGILLFRDPTERHLGEMMLEPLLDRFKSNGPRALIMLPAEEAGRLQGLNLPDAHLYEIVYELHRAMEAYNREAAGEALARLQAAAPEHRLTLHARYVLARYDAHNAEQLDAIDALLARFPDDPTFLLARIACLRELDRRDERLDLLRRLSAQPNADLVFAQQYAQELVGDARQHRTAELLLRKVIRNRPFLAAPYFFLANLLWDQQRKEEALELYRFAACLDDSSDGLSRTYLRSARALNRTDEVIHFLEDRSARFGDKSSQPARILFNALGDLDRMDDAFAVLDHSLARRKTDGELLLFAAEMRAAYGETKTAQSLLRAAKDKARPTAWLRAAANLAGMQGNLHEALTYWREVSAAEPLAMDAHRAIALRIAETESRAAALEYLKGLTERHPRHYGLLQLRIEWLRSEGPAAVEPVVRKLIEYHPSDAWAHRELALHLAELKRYDDALAEMDAAARLEPPSPSYHCVLGRVLTLAGRTDDAREQYRAALRLTVDNDLAVSELMQLAPGRPERREELEFIEKELHRQPHLGDGVLAWHGHAVHTFEPEEVHRSLQEMLHAREDLWQCWSAMVLQLLNMERFPEARALVEQAIERFPMLPRLWLDRSYVLAATGDNDGQIEALRQALRISPGWGPAMRELAEALDRDGKLEAACDLLKQAVSRAPLDPANRGVYAEKLWKIGQSAAAVEQLQEALKLDPSYDWAWRSLASWCERMDEPEKVLAFARELTQRRPGDPRTWLALVRLLNNPADTDEVLASLDRVLALSPRHPEARDLKAERLTEQGRYAEARDACRIAPGEEAAPMILQGRAAWVEARAGNLQGAIGQMERIVENEPGYFWGWQQLADWYHDAGQLDDYLKAASKLVELRPDNPVALTRRGEAQMLVGERESGKADLRQAQQMAPDYPLPGMLLFDEYMADDELDAAGATLAILQEHVADDFVIARQCQLAARQDDQSTALDAFRNLCESPIEATWPITSALSALRAAGWSDEADQILKESIHGRLFHPQAVLLWMDSPSGSDASPDEMLDLLDKASSKHPRFLFAYDRKAELLARLERWDEAIEACKPKIFDGPGPVILRGRAAWIEYQRGRRDPAISRMEELVAEEPDYYWGWQQLANWYEDDDQPEKFLEAAEQLVRLAPRDPSAYVYRGEARRANNDSAGAKEDFTEAFEMDPDYLLAGLNLLDAQLEDDELEAAAETLEELQSRENDAHIRLRAIRLAVKRGEQSDAMEILEEYTSDDEASPAVFREAIAAMEEAGWGKAVDRVLDSAIDLDSSAPLVGRFWVERRMAQNDHRCTEKFDDLLARGPIGEQALVAYLDSLGQNKDAEHLQPFVNKYREALIDSTQAWGQVGWAYASVHQFDRTAEWMSDWRKRDDAASWMLLNLAIALRSLKRDAEAREVSEFALKNSEPDRTYMYHSVWLAFDDALAGRIAEAARRTAQHEKDDEQLDEYFRVVHALTQALLMVERGGRSAFPEARSLIEKAAQENQDLDSDPAIHHAWKACVSKLGRITNGIGAWLWARRSAKNPPLPPAES